ncbi:hypothetical protein [Streptomyces sp. NPDC018059]|uniref:hypothetical protein n=1 Tax=Streptomyces sp. NPDC018059 TaxID=3365041 RepID=UPI0037940A95
MKWSELSPVLLGLLALAGAMWQGRRPRYETRDRLMKDLELLNSMPDDLPIRDEYKQHVSDSFTSLIKDEDQRTRNMSGVRIGVSLMGISALFIWMGFSQGGGWWHILTIAGALLFTISLFGAADDAVKRHRDETGRAITRRDSDTAAGPDDARSP